MIKCVIIEDDSNTIAMLSDIVTSNFNTIKIAGNASNILDGIVLIKKTEPDFIFLDINLEDGNSFEILKQFPNPFFKIVFITSYSKYAVEAFKFSALDFVLKPFIPDEIINATNKVLAQKNIENYNLKINTFFNNYTSENKKLILSNADHIHVVNIKDIMYAESDNSYTTFYIIDGRKILISKPLKYYDEKLSLFSFIRIHQKYLINPNFIKKYLKRTDELMLSNDTILPVSQSKKKQLLFLLAK